MAATSVTAGCGAFDDTEPRDPGTFGVDDPPTATATTRPLRPAAYSQFDGTTARLPAADRVLAFSPAESGSAASLVLRVAFEQDATAARPATLRATLRNRSAESVTVDTRGIPAFEPAPAYRPVDAASAGGGFALAPTPDHPFSLSTPAVARSADGSWTVPSVDAWLPEAVTVDAWANLTGRYAVVGVDPDRDSEASDDARSRAAATTADGGADGAAGAGGETATRDGRGDGATGRIATGRYRLGDGTLALSAYVWQASAPGPSAPERASGAGAPPLAGVGTWFQDVTSASATYLAPDQARVAVPGRLGLELVNHSERVLGGRTDQWRLYRLAGGGWKPLTWRPRTDVRERVLPGERVAWTLRLAHGDDLPAGDGIAVPYLGGGTYAFTTAYGDGYGAAFAVDAPELSLAPAAGVRVAREDGALVVTGPTVTADAEASVFELRRTTGSASTTFVTEQAYRDRVLRNALASADAADVVRYRTAARPRDGPFRWGQGPHRFAYDGTTYEVALVPEDAALD